MAGIEASFAGEFQGVAAESSARLWLVLATKGLSVPLPADGGYWRKLGGAISPSFVVPPASQTGFLAKDKLDF